MLPLNMPDSFRLKKEPEPPALLMKVHLSFNMWAHLMLSALSPYEKFTIIELQTEYTLRCWRDEILWEKWSKNAKTE